MSYKSPQSAGGQIMAIRQREEALRKYWLAPNICKHCDCPIPIGDNEKVSAVRKKKFCSRSCAASHNNFGRVRSRIQPIGYCERCGAEIMFRKIKNGCYDRRRKCCDDCLLLVKTVKTNGLTKAALFLRRKNWQSARSTITKNAREVFSGSGLKKECRICGYNKHIQVSHIKDVSDFDGTALIGEINDITNLVALCPNHHWEFDNHLLSNEDLAKIKY